MNSGAQVFDVIEEGEKGGLFYIDYDVMIGLHLWVWCGGYAIISSFDLRLNLMDRGSSFFKDR
jgi:hypothetical protein